MHFIEALQRLLGVATCPPGVVPAGRNESMDESAELVYCAANLAEADVIRSKLQSSGVPVYVRGESAGSTVYPLTIGPLAQVELFVPVSFSKVARDILVDTSFSAEELDALALQESVAPRDNSREGNKR